MKAKYYAGETCPESGHYGQYHDTNRGYAGADHDRHCEEGKPFPPSLNNYHFEKK